MWNIAIFTFGALIAAFAPNYAVLMLARIVVGLGLGGEMALGFTMVAELIPVRRRGTAAAMISLLHGGIGISQCPASRHWTSTGHRREQQ